MDRSTKCKNLRAVDEWANDIPAALVQVDA